MHLIWHNGMSIEFDQIFKSKRISCTDIKNKMIKKLKNCVLGVYYQIMVSRKISLRNKKFFLCCKFKVSLKENSFYCLLHIF